MSYKDDLKNFIYNPNLAQEAVLSTLYDATKGKIDIPDPTNPFIFLLENQALISSAAIHEVSSAVRKMYPHLALNKEELYHHLADTELVDIFASPSNGQFRLYINKNNMLEFGYESETYVELKIPKYTSITVSDIPFLLLNDIIVRL
jgi:hypothetical protein